MSEAGAECDLIIDADYDLGLHIGSLFIVGAFSLLGTAIPFIFKKYFSMSSLLFQSAKLMGAGVILSTAFNHMLVASFENLTSPCSGIEFGALAGVCALIGVLFTLIVQLIASETLSSLVSEQETHSAASTLKDGHGMSKASRESIVEIGESSALDDSCDKGHIHPTNVDSGHDHSHGGVIAHSNRVTAYLLELGIALHSVIIGIALGLARDEFVSLFIALVFHQFFEGIGLSSVVAEADFGKKWIAVGLVVFYTISTPIGVAIGIGIHDSLNENAQDYVVTQGVLDGLCAGILIYDAMVNILIPHFNGMNYRHSSFYGKVAHLTALVIGSSVMAIIAIWA
jgi:zinc transporter 1/2/3